MFCGHSYSVFFPKPFPFSFPLFPPNIPDSFCRTGSCLVETILPTLDCYRLTHHGCDRRETEGKKKESILKKPSKQALVYPPTFASSETLKQESFKVVWKPKRAWFFLPPAGGRKRARVSKQSDCHAGASGWYFERLLAWGVSLFKKMTSKKIVRGASIHY